MRDEIIIEREPGYIHVRQYGRDSYDISLDMWRRIVTECEKHDCFDILGESQTDEPLSTMDAYNHIEIFKLAGVTKQHRIAWVNHVRKTDKTLKFIENVLKNRSLAIGGLFPNIEEAKRWLLSEGDGEKDVPPAD